MSHYYQNNSNLKENKQMVNYQYLGENLQFLTDSGVFSRTKIDFGTHVLLETLKKLPITSDKILDVGCGYGAIGLSLAKTHPNASIVMVDVVKKAVELCLTNVKQNGIGNVTVIEEDLLEHINDQFDLIVSNPPIRAGKKTVFAIVDQAFLKLNDTGKLLFVIQKKQGALSLKQKMENVFGNSEIINKKNGYLILQSQK
ncbi:MAG: class I SAM-dependent methyltransferase [Bacilli bacterium]